MAAQHAIGCALRSLGRKTLGGATLLCVVAISQPTAIQGSPACSLTTLRGFLSSCTPKNLECRNLSAAVAERGIPQAVVAHHDLAAPACEDDAAAARDEQALSAWRERCDSHHAGNPVRGDAPCLRKRVHDGLARRVAGEKAARIGRKCALRVPPGISPPVSRRLRGGSTSVFSSVPRTGVEPVWDHRSRQANRESPAGSRPAAYTNFTTPALPNACPVEGAR